MSVFLLCSLMREEALLPELPSPHCQARCRHDLLHCLVIILSYPIMFFKVKNARTLLWLHLGILQHLEDGKKKKKNTEETKNNNTSSFLCATFQRISPLARSQEMMVLLASTPRLSPRGCQKPG